MFLCVQNLQKSGIFLIKYEAQQKKKTTTFLIKKKALSISAKKNNKTTMMKKHTKTLMCCLKALCTTTESVNLLAHMINANAIICFQNFKQARNM